MWRVGEYIVHGFLPTVVEMSNSSHCHKRQLTKISFMVYSVVYIEDISLHSQFQHVF